MPLNYNREEPITVGDLVKVLKRVPNDAKVYIVLDKGEQNYNEETEYYYDVHPLIGVEEEVINDYDNYNVDNESETNCLLSLEESFYYNVALRVKESPGWDN